MGKNNILKNELETINEEIREDLVKKSKLKDRIHQIKNRILAVIMLIVVITTIVPMTLVLVDLLVAAKISLILLFAISIANPIIGVKKIKQVEKQMDEIENELKYLNKTKQNIEKDVEKDSNKNITIDSINKNYSWKNKVKLMRTYALNKNNFVKHYKKGDLYETLKESGYNNQDSYYLYTRTQDEFTKANKQKILKR